MFSFFRSLALPLPTFGIALPANIQRRFLSFILKYFLGHLVKPGQLDDHKIDAQIGSGKVEIKDVELDAVAINNLLADLPVTLRDGSLGNVSVRVPWPNVLAAPFSVSVSGVMLALVLRRAPTSQSSGPTDVDLTASVASLAEKFVHKDLSEDEGNTLRQSVHLEPALESSTADEFSMPGSMDPFLGATIPTSTDEPSRFSDEEGVGVLTAVAERLMARFTCSARDISITLIHEGHAAFHFGVTEFSYGDGTSEANVTKSVSLRGFSISTTMLEPLDHSSQSYSSLSPAESPGRRHSEDDKPESMMQSIASLTESAMFQSAISTVHRGSTSPTVGTHQEPSRTRQILSFSDEPVLITIATRAKELQPAPSLAQATRQRSPKFTITASMGYVACAVHPLDVGSILRALALVKPASTSDHQPVPTKSDPKRSPLTFEGSGRIRGVVVALLLENNGSPSYSRPQLESDMVQYFKNPTHSLSTPHFRLRVDSIEPTMNSMGVVQIQINEISLFRAEGGPNPSSIPLLITDPNLDSQYPANTNAPMFDIVDWTKPNAQAGPPKISAWRLRAIPGQKPKSIVGPMAAIRVEFEPSSGISVSILPLHFFLDLKALEDAISFSYGIGSIVPDIVGDETELGDQTPPSTPQFIRSVADDMEQAEKQEMGVSISCPLIRIQLRTPSPPTKKQRSGAIVIDLHSIRVHPGSTPVELTWGRLLVALSNAGDTKATTVLSIGPPRSQSPPVRLFGGTTPTQRNLNPPETEQSRILIRTGAATTLEVQLLALYVHLTKFSIDGLQYWIDDATQWAEHAFDERRLDQSRDTSLIGSRFFATSGSLGTVETVGKASKSQLIVLVNLERAEIVLFVPRQTSIGSTEVLPFEITANGLDLLLEMKPDGKDETRISASLMDAVIANASGSPLASLILARTHPLNLAGHAKPVIKLNLNAITDPETGSRENRIRLTLAGITFTLAKTYLWANDLADFVKSPPETFEAVVPTERLHLEISLSDSCVKLVGPSHPGALVVVAYEVHFNTNVIGSSPETISNAALSSVTVMLVDEERAEVEEASATPSKVRFANDVDVWKRRGFASLLVIDDLKARITARKDTYPPMMVDVSRMKVGILACADTLGVLASFGADVATMFPKPPPVEKPKIHAVQRTDVALADPHGVLGEVEEHTFRREPELFTPDMINDDLPTNTDYLDDSFGGVGGLIEFSEDELLGESSDEGMSESILDSRATFEAASPESAHVSASTSQITIATEPYGDDSQKRGAETIRMLVNEDIRIIEDYFETVEPDPLVDVGTDLGVKVLSLNIQNCDITVRLHDGYDWEKTRLAIEQGRKAVRRRLEKIRQLLASGQVPDESIEDTHTVLFNSVYLGLQQDLDEMEPEAMIAVIDQELADDGGDTATVSSWQTFAGQGPRPTHKRQSSKTSSKRHRLTRSRGPRIEICVRGLTASVDQFQPNESTAMRVLATVRNLEILDHIKTSTWSAFLTGMSTDSRGNVRETDSNMIRAELCIVRPVQDLSVEEARLKLKVLPIRLHVDQDALDFLKKFFMFKDPDAEVKTPDSKPAEEMFLQRVEIFPIDLKLDYKPKRVDYRALREGRTIELMNFFHFEGAEMTLRHITLSGITGWARLGDTLNDLWTPDVKATQLAEIVAGIAPFRSLVRVGAGVADLVLLPTSTGWRRDRRREKGVRGAAAEAAALGAKLATGAQVVLERAESMLGGASANEGGSSSGFVGARPGPGVGAFRGPLTLIPTVPGGEWDGSASMLAPTGVVDDEAYLSEEGSGDERMISRYAEQPRDVREGIQSATRALRKNATAAAQTILAIPMEVYEQTESEGPIRAVVRAVPIAVLRPMIGATEAVGQTLMGLRNSLDPAAAIDEGSKWKRR